MSDRDENTVTISSTRWLQKGIAIDTKNPVTLVVRPHLGETHIVDTTGARIATFRFSVWQVVRFHVWRAWQWMNGR